MKYKILLILFSVAIIQSSCKKNILDQTPKDQYSDATVWADINLAEAYLLNNYEKTRIGFSPFSLSALTDEIRFTHGGADSYMLGQLSPSNLGPFGGNSEDPAAIAAWDDHFRNIQEINKFLANIDRVEEASSETEKPLIREKIAVLKGEALFLRAYSYGQLLRMYGGVPLFSTPSELGQSYTSVVRNSFAETVDFIVKDCDDAYTLLPDPAEATMGRANKGVALALKSRILLFAASDLTADGTAPTKFVGYENPDRNALWTRAKAAAKQLMDLNYYSLADFGAPDKAQVAKNFYDFFKAKDLSSPEVIWGKMYNMSVNYGHTNNQFNDGNGWNGYSDNSATQELVDDFQMEDGSAFSDHFTIDGGNFYKNTSTTFHSDNPYYNREPRFYAFILYDSAIWKPRDAAFQALDPLGIYDRRTRITINGGVETAKSFGLDTRQGPRSPDNGGFTGYLMKKTLDNEVITGVRLNENAWIEMRYAEILLNYAEACLGLGETSEASTYINQIRHRSALPDYTGDATTALRRERKIELCFEGSRWYDIRRWKIFQTALSDAHGIDIVETNTDGTITTTWRNILAQPRTVSEQMLWLPISNDEVNRAPGLVQNPGY